MLKASNRRIQLHHEEHQQDMCRHVDMQYVAHFNGSVQNTDKSQAQTANIKKSVCNTRY